MPLIAGYSRAAIGENIRRERRRGRSGPQAAAIAYSEARSAWRRRHRGGRLPAAIAARNPAHARAALLAITGAALWLVDRQRRAQEASHT